MYVTQMASCPNYFVVSASAAKLDAIVLKLEIKYCFQICIKTWDITVPNRTIWFFLLLLDDKLLKSIYYDTELVYS